MLKAKTPKHSPMRFLYCNTSLIYVQTARKDVFGSCRLPLAMFKMANSRFDLGQVIALRLRFPSLAGAVVMDDICIEEGVKASV